MVKNGKSDKTRSNRKQIMPREIKRMLRAPAVLNAKEAKKFREVLKEVAEFVKPQDPFARYDVEDFAYDRVEGERYRGLKTALIARSKSQRLKRAVTESKAKYDRRMQDACDAAETKLLTDLSKREPLPDKAELERLEAESNAELAKFRAKLQSEFEEEKKRLEQEINSLDDAMFLEEWIALCEQVDRLQSTTEKRTENTRSRLERRAPGEPLRNREEIIDVTAIEETLVAQQPLIAATRPDLPAPTAAGSQPESVAAVLTAEEPEALRPQVMIAPPATNFDMPDQASTGSHLEMPRAERPATEPAPATGQEIDCTPVGADLIDRAAADAKVEALAAQATPEEVAVTQRQNMEPRTIEPALQLLVDPTEAVEMEVDAAEEEPEEVERVVSTPMRPASTTALPAVAQQAGLSLSATTPRIARPELMPAVSKATTKPAKISSPAIPSGPAPAWAGIAAALGIDPQQAVAIEFAGAKKTGTPATSSAPSGIPRNMQGIYRALIPQLADDS